MATRFFRKIGQGATRLFSKISSDAPRILGRVSNTLNDASTIARKIENTGRDVLSNPLVQAGTSLILGPEAAPIMEGGSALLGQLSDVGQLAKQASNLTDTSTYKGGVQGVSQDILQRSQNIGANANAIKQNIQNQSQNNFV